MRQWQAMSAFPSIKPKEGYLDCAVLHKISPFPSGYQGIEDKLKTNGRLDLRLCLGKRSFFEITRMGVETTYIYNMKTIETTEEPTLCLRVGRVAEMLDCSISKVYDLVSEGHLETIKLSEGKKAGVRILSTSLNRFLRDGGVVSGKAMTLADKVNAQKPKYRRSSSEWF